MSFIETAIKKVQQSARGVGDTATRDKRPRIPARAEATTSVPARQFRRAALDPGTMERSCVLPEIKDQAALRAYKILRTRMLQRLAASQWHSVAITGTESGQGKTVTAINLAVALAQDPSTHVFLVDLDLQRPQIANYLGMKYERGLADYLLGEASIEEIIYDTDLPRLSVVPNARSLEHSSEHLAGPKMSALLAALNAEVPRRVVIYDTPPILLSDDVLTFAPHVDAVALVVSEGVTARGSVERSKELLAEMNLIGVILNRSAERSDSAYY